MKKIDELKAEIENAEKELRNKREEFVRLTEIREGDYIEVTTSDGNILIGILITKYHNGVGYKIETWKDEGIYAFKSIKKWQPKKGDLCIFLNNEFKDCSYIDIFSDRYGVHFDNCIPFISEQQFKDHIGYE